MVASGRYNTPLTNTYTRGKVTDRPTTYAAQAKHFKDAFKANNVCPTKVTHSGRVCGANHLISEGCVRVIVHLTSQCWSHGCRHECAFKCTFSFIVNCITTI